MGFDFKSHNDKHALNGRIFGVLQAGVATLN